MKLVILLLLTLVLMSAGISVAYGDNEATLKLIQKDLEEIKESQAEILQGQQKLSQEHASLKIWINKRR